MKIPATNSLNPALRAAIIIVGFIHALLCLGIGANAEQAWLQFTLAPLGVLEAGAVVFFALTPRETATSGDPESEA